MNYTMIRLARVTSQSIRDGRSRGGSSVQPLASQHFPNVTNGYQRLRVGDEVFLKSV
ncbi:hypothetical protein Hanom_Chr12g01104951 [Helianthus anomalus]